MYLYECTRPDGVSNKDWENCKKCKVASCGFSSCFKPNEKWKEQKGICQYEHCIENMPLHEEETKRCIELGYFSKRADRGWHRCNADDEGAIPDLDRYFEEFGLSEKSCPNFGHECPGGVEQVKLCNEEE